VPDQKQKYQVHAVDHRRQSKSAAIPLHCRLLLVLVTSLGNCGLELSNDLALQSVRKTIRQPSRQIQELGGIEIYLLLRTLGLISSRIPLQDHSLVLVHRVDHLPLDLLHFLINQGRHHKLRHNHHQTAHQKDLQRQPNEE